MGMISPLLKRCRAAKQTIQLEAWPRQHPFYRLCVKGIIVIRKKDFNLSSVCLRVLCLRRMFAAA
jgi:hypothetical protein